MKMGVPSCLKILFVSNVRQGRGHSAAPSYQKGSAMKSYTCAHIGYGPHRPTCLCVFAHSVNGATLAYRALKHATIPCSEFFDNDDIYDNFKDMSFGVANANDGWHFFVNIWFFAGHSERNCQYWGEHGCPNVDAALNRMDKEVFGSSTDPKINACAGQVIRDMKESLNKYIEVELEVDYSCY